LYYRDPADDEWRPFATTDLAEEVQIGGAQPPIKEGGYEIWIDTSDDVVRTADEVDGWTFLDKRFVNADGDRMLGPLSLVGPPHEPFHAATKEYVDERVDSQGSVPIGVIVPFGGRLAPPRWHLCDGTVHGSPALEEVLGSDRTPDLRSGFILVSGNGYPHGSKGGAERVALTVSNMPRHNHGGATGPAGEGATGDADRWQIDPALLEGDPSMLRQVGSGPHAHPIPSDGGSAPFSIMPPYFALNHIIYKGA
jgi:microcystin-dependent protein